jgi:calcium/proton exchanger cax
VYKEQTFHAVISEVGSGLILVAGFALLIPSAFYASLSGSTVPNGSAEGYTENRLRHDTLNISHGVSIILIVAFCLYIIYNSMSHDNIFREVLEADEEADQDRHRDLKKNKLTFTECCLAIVVGLTFISLIAVFLVEEIEFVVEHGVPDEFLGLILVPLVEKAAEHLTAIDEAYDNQIVSTFVRRERRMLTVFAELRTLPLPGTVDSDRTIQCAACGHCWMGSGQADGPQFRDFHGGAADIVDSRSRQFLARWIF